MGCVSKNVQICTFERSCRHVSCLHLMPQCCAHVAVLIDITSCCLLLPRMLPLCLVLLHRSIWLETGRSCAQQPRRLSLPPRPKQQRLVPLQVLPSLLQVR